MSTTLVFRGLPSASARAASVESDLAIGHARTSTISTSQDVYKTLGEGRGAPCEGLGRRAASWWCYDGAPRLDRSRSARAGAEPITAPPKAHPVDPVSGTKCSRKQVAKTSHLDLRPAHRVVRLRGHAPGTSAFATTSSCSRALLDPPRAVACSHNPRFFLFPLFNSTTLLVGTKLRFSRAARRAYRSLLWRASRTRSCGTDPLGRSLPARPSARPPSAEPCQRCYSRLGPAEADPTHRQRRPNRHAPRFNESRPQRQPAKPAH